MSTATIAPVITRRQLGRLATDAALELNSLIKSIGTTFDSVAMLAMHLRSKVDPVEGAKPASLISNDLGVMAALSRALESAEHKKARDAVELTNMTEVMAEKLEQVGLETPVTTAEQLRDFCLSLSSRLSASGFEQIERRPANPWRR